MKTSRNDPCPCGSARKYKHCCLDKQTTPPTDLAWRRVRQEIEGLSGRMLRFTASVYGPEVLDQAWREFMLWDDNESTLDDESPHAALFLSWLLHRWSPNPDETDVADARLHEVSPTRLYLERKGRHLSPLVRDYLQSCLERPFSFYEIERVEPGRGLTLRDMATDQRHDVHERSASQSLSPQEVIYAQLASADGVTLIEALSAIALLPGDKVPVITLCKRMRQENIDFADTEHDFEAQQMWDIETRELYLSLSERYLYPSPPELVTSDGEVVELHTLIYDIDSAHTAFDALGHLNALIDDPTAAEFDTQRDAGGLVQRARIDWTRIDHDGNAVSGALLGTLNIDGTRLTAQVKSRERAERLKAIIDEKLGAHATFRVDKIQTPAQAMAEAAPPSSLPLPQDSPEAQAIITDYLQNHYQQWVDIPLPALANETPRDTVKTPEGREQVEALLHAAEHHDLGLPAATRKSIFDAVRLQLGLQS